MKGGRLLWGRVFLCLRCEKDVFLLNNLVATYGHESSCFMPRSVRPPETTQMCFKFSSLLISAGFCRKLRKWLLHLQPFLLWHRKSSLQHGSWNLIPGVASPQRRSHMTDNTELVRSAVLALSMITLAWQRFYHEHCGNFLKLIGSY